MGNFETADKVAEKLRQESYHLLRNDCITKSMRLKKACKTIGIPVRVVVCIGRARAKWFGLWLTVPVIHAWGEVEGKRLETSRPLGASGHWSIVPMNIRPVVRVKF